MWFLQNIKKRKRRDDILNQDNRQYLKVEILKERCSGTDMCYIGVTIGFL
jgi:hypothetical protein